MIITSKFPGRCSECGREIRMGDRISWSRGTRVVQHAACSAEGRTALQAVADSRATELPTANGAELPVPSGLEYLPFQRAGIAYALRRRSTLIADEMGLGKTVQAIGWLNASANVHTALIVCPASLKLNWRRECEKWLTREAAVTVFVLIVNYEQLSKLHDGAYDVVILDEAHYIKNPKAARSKLAMALAKRAKHVLCLTGTPIMNKPVELWSLLQILDPETWDPPGTIKGRAVGAGEGAGFFRFAKRYCDAHQEQVARNKTVWVFDGHSNLAELNERLRATVMVRRLKADVLVELPAKRRIILTIPSACKDGERWLGDCPDDYEEMTRRVAAIPFTEWSQTRHEQGMSKVDAAVEHIANALESGSAKIIVFAHHKDVMDALREKLAGYGVVSLTGEDSATQRDESVTRFQSDPSCRVFVGSLKAAGVGLTLTAASHVVFVEASPVPADMSQAEDRAHRIGQRESVLVEVLVLEGSIDARMMALVQAKQAVADLALDADTLDTSERELVESGEERRARALREADLTENELESIHERVRWLASRCDGARAQDGAGFNRIDSMFGHALAEAHALSPRMALDAKKMLVKYQEQLENIPRNIP